MADDILTLPPPPADARVTYGSDGNQFIDLRFPEQTQETYSLVMNIHGGFWRSQYDLDHAGHLCAALAARGPITANVEYRRVGKQGGGWPETVADIRAAYSFLMQNAAQWKIDAERIVVMGHSAGGQLALCLAAYEAGVRRVISLAGVLALRRAYELHLSRDAVVEFLGGTPAEVPDHYREADPMQLEIPQARQWLIHGTADDVVPADLSRGYVAAKGRLTGNKKEDVHLLQVPDAGHYDLIDPRSAAWTAVEQTVVDALS
jgi:acetyl esterase/lipase